MKSEREAGYFVAKVVTGFMALLLLTIGGTVDHFDGFLTASFAFAAIAIAFGGYTVILDYYGGTENQFRLLLLVHLVGAFLAVCTFLAHFEQWLGWVFGGAVLVAHAVVAHIARTNRKNERDEE